MKKKMKENFLIVIGRQYGSGGREIGRKLAGMLGVDYFDKRLLSEAAGRIGYAPELFSRADEKRPSRLRSLLGFSYGSLTGSYSGGTLTPENLYAEQSHAISEICDGRSCVIIGRTADYVMREHPRMISVFIHAPLEWRAQRILSRGEVKDLDLAMEMARKIDRERESYYNYFTGRKWGDASNYHLSIDPSKISVDKAVEIIISFLNHSIGTD